MWHTADCKIIGTGPTVFNGFLFQFTNGKRLKTVEEVSEMNYFAIHSTLTVAYKDSGKPQWTLMCVTRASSYILNPLKSNDQRESVTFIYSGLRLRLTTPEKQCHRTREHLKEQPKVWSLCLSQTQTQTQTSDSDLRLRLRLRLTSYHPTHIRYV